MEFLAEYGMFLAKAVTVIVALAIVIGLIASAGQKNKKQAEGHIEVVNLSEEIREVQDDIQKEILDEYAYKLLHKERVKKEKAEQKEKIKQEKKAAKAAKKNKDKNNAVESTADETTPAEKQVAHADDDSVEMETEQKADTKASSEPDSRDNKSRLFILDFDGDMEASAVENLREEISAVVSVAEAGDQVLLRLESPGGMVHAYGLAASQLARIKQAKLELIIAVDQVAASGGYMMACVADRILAAPFAVVGSIGVVAELPNFHRLLQHNKVDYEQHTAGEYKRTLTMFAQNSDKAREKFKQELEETHELFKQFISENRASLDLKKVATGEHWYGAQALELGLVDELGTSDDFILKKSMEGEVFRVRYEVRKPLSERLAFSVHSALEKTFLSLWQKSIESKLFKS